MRITLILAAATALALPAVASARTGETVRQLQARGCTFHQAPAPAGKIMIAPPIVRCPGEAAQLAANRPAPTPAPASPQAGAH